jgi:cytosine/adenosine deaminase-related metal-dependent hydrolase
MSELIVRGANVICDASSPNAEIIPGGAVAIQGATIAAVGPFDEIRKRFEHAEVVGSGRHMVMPGLVNSHHHGWGLTSFQLGAKDDLLEPWIIEFMRAMRPIDPYLDTLWADLQNIRSGVTTVLHAGVGRDWSAYEGEVREKLRAHADSGIRAAYALHLSDQNSFVYQDDDTFVRSLPSELAQRLRSLLSEARPLSAEGVLSLLERLVTEYEGHPRLTLMICPIAPQWCSDKLLQRIRLLANELGVLIHLHCLESPYQREYARRAYGKPTLRHLHDLGFLDTKVSLAHAVWLSDEEMDICAANGVSVSHNASSNLRLRVGILPLARLLEKGVNVSIGMDGTTLNDDEDMLQELRLVAVAKLQRLPRALPPEPAPESMEILGMATANGARTLAMESTIGRLKPGYRADLVLLDMARLSRPYLHPATDPLDAVLYRASAIDVDAVLIDGEFVLREGRFTRLDSDEICSRLAAAAALAMPEFHSRRSAILEELRPHVASFWADWQTAPVDPYHLVNSAT